MGISTNFDA